MVRSGRGPSPFRAWHSLLPGAGCQILPEAAPTWRAGGRCIGPAIALLPLLACCGLLPSTTALARRSRWALGVLSLLAGVVLLPPAPAEAQTTIDLVSNFNETLDTDTRRTTYRAAQSFTTGANSGGYILTEVKLRAHTTDASVVVIQQDSSGLTGNIVATLTGGGTNIGIRTYTAPRNTTLSASTKYWVVINDSGSFRKHWNPPSAPVPAF